MSGNRGRAGRTSLAQGMKALLELSKLHLGLYIALSAVAGHVLALGRTDRAGLVLGGWVLILAAGSGVMNNIQDRTWDARFARTRERVLVRGAFPLVLARIIALGLAGTGLLGLYLFYISPLPFILGISALACYNGLYTPMKKKTPWALAPGVICGVIPPAIGWAAVPEGPPGSGVSGLVILMACLGCWQLPHFWLVEMARGTKGPEPGTACFTRIWPDMACQIMIWAGLFSLGIVLFLIRGWVSNGLLAGLVFILALGLPPAVALCLLGSTPRDFRPRPERIPSTSLRLCFRGMNLSMLVFLVLVILDRI